MAVRGSGGGIVDVHCDYCSEVRFDMVLERVTMFIEGFTLQAAAAITAERIVFDVYKR